VKLVLSRKGFDSSVASGGCASPILPDGQLLSLPIPHGSGRVAYIDLRPRAIDVAHVVADLSHGRVPSHALAHLDPDLERTSRHRPSGWLPAFGQDSIAQRHLQRQGVGAGDLFLFFGWFREVELVRGCYRFQRDAPDRHVLFGWLRVGQVLQVGRDALPEWLQDHPHVGQTWPHNTIYVATYPKEGGVFATFNETLVLTETGMPRSVWKLPTDFMPRSRQALTYHKAPGRWTEAVGGCRLQTVSKGQEFVLDLAEYPEVLRWAEAKVLLAG
jgi:hypothetical protein